jgi:hypothetical protein
MKITPQNISKAVDISFGKFDPFRRARGKFMSQMVGRFYGRSSPGDREDRKAAPINMLHTAMTTLVPNLVYNSPKVKVTTDLLPYRSYADLLGMALNHLVDRIDLRMALRKAITDAIFMAGFVKTGLATGDQFLTMDGIDIEIGQPFAERVDPDDIVLDPMARDWDEQSFIGNRFRANLDDLLATGLYDEDQLIKLSGPYDGTGSVGEAEKLIGGNSAEEFKEIQRYVDLVDVYLPREQVVVTLPYQKNSSQDTFLRVADYEGPDHGPYHMLGFAWVPNNLLPVAPAGIWYDLHILGNRIARKLSRQAERIKRVLAYQSSAEEDATQIAEADDGETVRVDDINGIKEVQYGGAGEDSYAYMEWVKRQFSEQAGSLDLLSGTGSNTPTATQAELLNANSSVRLSDMQNAVYTFTKGISRDLAYHLHTDPLINLPLTKRQPTVDPVTGMGQMEEVQVHFSPDVRAGTWLDYNIDIKPYSMARPDPNTQVRRRLEFATNVIPAGAQAVALLGPGFNIGAFLRRMAEEVGLDDADEFINDPAFQQWMMQRLQMNTGDPGKANQSLGMGMMGAPMGQMQPNQPNPGAKGPNGGITPDQETNAARQDTAGDLQATPFRQPSAMQLANARGL